MTKKRKKKKNTKAKKKMKKSKQRKRTDLLAADPLGMRSQELRENQPPVPHLND